MVSTPESLRGVRVLVVEDETLIAEEIRERLTRLGLTVVGVVDTGPRAVQAAERDPPDVVLMDIRLKGPLDGVQTADAIARAAAVPVVFVTAHSDQETVRRAKAAGPFGFLVKPFQERDLVITLELALSRHGLERRVRESERRYAATLASIGDGVVATDPDGRVTLLNAVAEALTRWPAADARGRPVEEVCPVVPEAAGAAAGHPAREALRTRRVVHAAAPVVLVGRGGERIPVDDSAAPITDDGRVLGAVVAFRDARQRRVAEDALRRAEEQLRQAQKMEAVGRLAGGVAHDFNNLLTVIIGFADMLLGSGRLDAPAQELADQIRKAGVRAAELTRQLLAFSRKQVLQPAAVDLGALLADTARMLRRLLGEDVVLTTSAAPGLWPVWADPGQLEQVVLNLAVNARDAMPNGGRLAIEAANVEMAQTRIQSPPGLHPRQCVVLTVTDTGVGMDRATQDRVFEPFFTTKEVGKGTGLGLATVYGIVKQSGGLIELHSEVGKGTTFRVYFPALPTAAPAGDGGQAGGPPGGAETVLLVEDDAAVRSLVAAALRHYGYAVHEAETGEAAVAVFAAHPGAIRLVVTDVVMPGMTGRELAERVRAADPAVRVLFVSGYTDDAVVQRGVHAGEVAFLQKPFTLAGLAQKVRETLDRAPGSAAV